MYLNNFSVRIPEGNEIAGGYVEMENDTKYRLILRNQRESRCDAKVEIDGKEVGVWRLKGQNGIILERPANDDGCFTFYEAGTWEGEKAGLRKGDPNLGLIKVTFTPEFIENVNEYKVSYEYEPGFSEYTEKGISYGAKRGIDCGASYGEGGTGLSGISRQRFVDAGNMRLDYSQQTVIHLRLVCDKNRNNPRPLTSFSSPVPPSVG